MRRAMEIALEFDAGRLEQRQASGTERLVVERQREQCDE